MIVSTPHENENDGAEIVRELTIVNKLGLHQRPAAMFVKLASKFQSEILIEKDGEQVNGKSILGMLTLAAGRGTKLKLTARGRDAARAVKELEDLVKKKFDED